METYIHPKAIVDESASIGRGTRIWAFAHILGDARIGDACNICDHTFIEGGVVVGDRVTIKSGVYLLDGVILEDDVFVGPNATFTNDPFPRSRKHPTTYPVTLIRDDGSTDSTPEIIGRYARRHADRIEVIRDGRGNLGPVGNFAAPMDTIRAKRQILCITRIQARQFLTIYDGTLSPVHRSIVKNYAEISEKGFVGRRLAIMRGRFWMTGTLKNLGMLLCA